MARVGAERLKQGLAESTFEVIAERSVVNATMRCISKYTADAFRVIFPYAESHPHALRPQGQLPLLLIALTESPIPHA